MEIDWFDLFSSKLRQFLIERKKFMKKEEFVVGMKFRRGTKLWLCTDIGSRVITAVCLSLCKYNDWGRSLSVEIQDRAWDRVQRDLDPSWIGVPPYTLLEHVFNENDIKECEFM